MASYSLIHASTTCQVHAWWPAVRQKLKMHSLLRLRWVCCWLRLRWVCCWKQSRVRCSGEGRCARRRRARAHRAQACRSLHRRGEHGGRRPAQVGIQEKTAFVVAGKKLSGGQLYQPIVSIPATIELLLVRTCFRLTLHCGCAHRRAARAARVALHCVCHIGTRPRPLECCLFSNAWRGTMSCLEENPAADFLDRLLKRAISQTRVVQQQAACSPMLAVLSCASE